MLVLILVKNRIFTSKICYYAKTAYLCAAITKHLSKIKLLQIMKKLFLTIAVCMMAAMNCQADVEQEFTGIDQVNVAQKIDLDTCNVYIVPKVLAEMKSKKKAEEQQVAFDELGKTLQRELMVAFRKGKYHVISNPKEAPAGATVVEATLKDIDWGSGVKRQLSMGAAGKMSAGYSVKVTNAKGLVLEYDTRRSHYTGFNSALAPDVIRVYNRVLAWDLISVLRKTKSDKAAKAHKQSVAGIDYVNVEQKVNLDNSTVYIVPTVLAVPRGTKKLEKQQEAFAEVGNIVKDELQDAFKKTTFQVVADIKDVPAGATVAECTLKEIDWGTATSLDVMGGSASLVWGGYNVRMSNAKGMILEYDNFRRHNTALSDNPVGIIRSYSRAMASDLIEVLKN